ncbi:MAG: potassium/proton antiporter [Bryobacterales bacterium]|nr:potassium/proton antiporter [Bryobacterales bacterium]
MTPIEYSVFLTSVLLLFAILASKASSRLGVPGLLLFLAIGMLAGSDGPGGIYFDDAFVAQAVGVVALALILFAGGLDTNVATARQVLGKGLTLSTLGVLLTAACVGGFATWILDISLLQGMLLGSIVSSTDAAAVFSILRSRSVSLKRRTGALLELESGSNDPMAVFLTIGMIALLAQPDRSPWSLLTLFVVQMSIGALAGWVVGKASVHLLNRIRLDSDGLYPVLTLTLVLFTYGGTALLGGNGFLAVYLAGILIGDGDFIHKRSLIRFHDGLAWLMQIAMFLVLGLLVFPSRLPSVAGAGLAVAFFLMFVARPVSVFVSLALARMSLRERVLISWVGLRGAAPIILATFPKLAGVDGADELFNLVFFAVLASVLLQGSTIPLVARWLRLDVPLVRRKQYPIEFVPPAKSRSNMFEMQLPPDSPAAGKQLVDLKLPKTSLIVLINRDDDYLAPRGGTVLQAGDSILVLAETQDVPAVRAIMGLLAEEGAED